jgi:glutathione S-transferase
MEVDMGLQLVGHYDSPFVRRVGISLYVLGIPFERRLLSVFSDAAQMRQYNPLGRVPTLVLDDGERLVDSSAILDHLDEVAGPQKALLPARGRERREALQLMALATGVSDKAVAAAYERRKPAGKVDEAWIARCLGQQDAALAALEERYAAQGPARGRLMQPEITVATALGYVRLRQPEGLPAGHYPALGALCAHAEADPAFSACRPTLKEIGGPPQEAQAALFRLLGNGPTR